MHDHAPRSPISDASPAAATHARGAVGVFDGGIGSYGVVTRLRRAYPDQDVIYLADRASFPYGALTTDELLASTARAAQALIARGADSIVLASNAPSVTVLDRLRERIAVPVLGVIPPVRAALDAVPAPGIVAVAGARVMIDSAALAELVRSSAAGDAHRVVSVVADRLIALVESGRFLDPAVAATEVGAFVDELRRAHPRLAAITLSSTHLPWLAPAFAEVAPEIALFDPADDVVAAFAPLATPGSGRLTTLVTASARHPFEEFTDTLDRLGLDLAPTLVALDAAPISGRAASRYGTTENAVRDDLRRRILSGELSSGTRLGEAEIARHYDVSRPTARAAVASLVESRLLERPTHSAARVAHLGPDDVRDLYRTRQTLEAGAITQLAGERRVPPEAYAADAEIRALLDAPPAAVVDPDVRFHQALVAAIGSPRTGRAYDQLADELRLCMTHVQRAALLPTDLIAREHGEILERIGAGDAAGAVAALATHLERARERLVAHLD